jgi:septum site-determining protein MinC
MMLDESRSSTGERTDVSVAPETPIVPSDLPQLHLWMDGPVPVVRLPEAASFEVLRSALREQMPRLAPTIGGRSLRLDFGTRDVVLFDLRRLLHLLRQEFSVEATGLYVRREVVHRFAERELKLKLFPTDPPAPVVEAPTAPPPAAQATVAAEPALDAGAPAASAPPEPEAVALRAVTLPHDLDAATLADAPVAEAPAPPAPAPALAASTPAPAPPREEGRRAQTVQRTLRSGTVLRFDGDLYVFGDVNPGAQVIATGNITVLGALKGTAHAGAAGDESAFILAFDLRPMQLRIARVIAIPPDRRTADGLDPEIATVKDGQVVIEAWRRGR